MGSIQSSHASNASSIGLFACYSICLLSIACGGECRNNYVVTVCTTTWRLLDEPWRLCFSAIEYCSCFAQLITVEGHASQGAGSQKPGLLVD